MVQWYSFPSGWDTRRQFSSTRKSCSWPQRILWELKGPLSSCFLTKVSSLPSHWGNSYVYSFSLASCIFESIFKTSIFLKKCKVFANRNQKTVTAHFFWLTHLVCKWQFLPQEKSFPSHKPLCLPTVGPCQAVTITSFAPHRGNALSVGLTCRVGNSELTLANHSAFSVCFLAVIIQNIQMKAAYLTGMANVTNYG